MQVGNGDERDPLVGRGESIGLARVYGWLGIGLAAAFAAQGLLVGTANAIALARVETPALAFLAMSFLLAGNMLKRRAAGGELLARAVAIVAVGWAIECSCRIYQTMLVAQTEQGLSRDDAFVLFASIAAFPFLAIGPLRLLLSLRPRPGGATETGPLPAGSRAARAIWLAALVAGIVGPPIVYRLRGDRSSFVKAHAVRATVWSAAFTVLVLGTAALLLRAAFRSPNSETATTRFFAVIGGLWLVHAVGAVYMMNRATETNRIK